MTETATQMKSITALKEEYVLAKQRVEELQEAVAPLDAELKAEIERITAEHKARNAELYDALNDAIEATGVEVLLREAVVNHFNQTGEKTVDENLSVRVTTKLVYDTAKAVEWAETNAPIFIQKTVDKKAFEKVAADLDFVTVESNASAVIKGL